MKEFKVTKSCNLKDFTSSHYPQGSFFFDNLIRDKQIKVNGERAEKSRMLNVGDTVKYFTTPKQESALSHKVVYIDKNVLVADKFSGVESEALFFELGEKYSVFALHRLDRNTRGLIAYALNENAEKELLNAFKNDKVLKIYTALCKNNFKVKSERLCAYLKKDPEKSEVDISDKPKNGYKKIITEYEVQGASGDVAEVKITLHTGKTHQIRAHMAFIGCPVLGDEKYGDREFNDKYSARRQRLIAKKLTFFSLSGGLEYLCGKEFISEAAFAEIR